MTISHWKRIINEDKHGLFRFSNTKNAQKYQNIYLETQMEHDQSSYFCRSSDVFCWGPAPVGPTLVTGPQLEQSVQYVFLTVHLCHSCKTMDFEIKNTKN